MDNQVQPAVTIDVPAVLSGLRETIPAEKQVSWLQLCNGKQLTEDALMRKELALQSVLTGWETMEVLPLQNALELYKKGAAEMPEIRKGFTRYLDGITESLMVPEKRVAATQDREGNPTIFAKAIARYNHLRISNEKNQAALTAKAQECERFKAHVKNEYLRMETEYTVLLDKHIVDAYGMALSDPRELSPEAIEEYIKVTDKVMDDTKVGDPAKFVPYGTFEPMVDERQVLTGYVHKESKDVKITKEELGAIHVTIERPDFPAILTSRKTILREKFKMYSNDRANAAKAKEAMEREQQENKQKAEAEQTQKQAVNNLLASGAAAATVGTDGVKSLVRKKAIDCEDLTPTEAMAIITGFTGNWAKVFVNISVKQLSNLKVEQMAAALDKGDVKVESVRYKDIVK